MKHAASAALDQLELLLKALRATPGLKEKARGVFYRRAKAFLHFHEDPAGLFADVRSASGDFDRMRVSDAEGQGALLAQRLS
jgi:hypothetical protein